MLHTIETLSIFMQHVASNFKGCYGDGYECNYNYQTKWPHGVFPSVSKVTELIDLLQQYPCLYDTKDKKYHDRDVRGKAVTEIANALKQSGELNSFQYYRYWN